METYKSFYLTDSDSLAVAELSIMYPEVLTDLNLKSGTWWFFNRLRVPLKIRGRGHARTLLGQLREWAISNRFNIFNAVNPYDGSDIDRLIKLYEEFGFVRLLTLDSDSIIMTLET